ncbi:hypothetical protein MTP99_009073 [Tenebrio molitor]|nr:hypothetical protein MTP99_009073 [Tenebrio molitor]
MEQSTLQYANVVRSRVRLSPENPSGSGPKTAPIQPPSSAGMRPPRPSRHTIRQVSVPVGHSSRIGPGLRLSQTAAFAAMKHGR